MANIKYLFPEKEGLEAQVPDLALKLYRVAAQYKNVALIVFAGQPMIVACQGKCQKAEDVDPEVVVTGGETKLSHDQDFPNRYCVQNCLGCHTYDPRRNFELRKS